MKAEREREGGVKRAEAKGEEGRGDSVRGYLVQSPSKIVKSLSFACSSSKICLEWD